MKEIYIVKKNADFTEGRGPMVFHSAWEDAQAAVNYVKGQDGIYGSKQSIEYDKFGHFVYANGYEIDRVKLFTTLDNFETVMAERKRQAALAKLSSEDRKILGLE